MMLDKPTGMELTDMFLATCLVVGLISQRTFQKAYRIIYTRGREEFPFTKGKQ